MIFRKSVKKLSLLTAFLFIGAVLYAQDFAWSLDSAFVAQIDDSNIIIRDSKEFAEQYIIQTPYESLQTIQFVNSPFGNNQQSYYISFVTGTNIIEMRQLSYYTDEEGQFVFSDTVIFSMQGTEAQQSEQTEDDEEDDEDEFQTTEQNGENTDNFNNSEESDLTEAADKNDNSEETDEAVESDETKEEADENTEETDETEEKSEDEEAAEEEQDEKYEYEALALIRYKNTDTISFKLKVSYIPKPYILGISFSAGFTDYKLIQPFYFGGYFEPHVGIPQKAFPYKYELEGTTLKGPLIVGGKIYAPFGICVFPFQENIEFFVEIAPGISLNMMWDAKFGKNSITSKLYPAFYGQLRTGATYKGFSFFIEGNYDAILGFGVSAGFGYNLNFNLSSAPNNVPSSLEDK